MSERLFKAYIASNISERQRIKVVLSELGFNLAIEVLHFVQTY